MSESAGKATILIIDDEEMIRSIAGQMIEKLGYEVLSAGSGPEAVALFGREHARIDVVILDLIMPGMDGGQVLDRLKAISTRPRIVLSSGYSRDNQAEAVMARGCHGFIQKPFRLQELAALLEAQAAAVDRGQDPD